MNVYETNFNNYEQIDDKYRINKETGKVINKYGKFIKNIIEPKERDYSILKDIQKNSRKVEAKDMTTNEITIYRSLYACSKDVKINTGMVKLCCDGKYKQAISKENKTYTFAYSTDEPTKEVTRQLTIYDTKEERRLADRQRIKRSNSVRKVCECGTEHTAGGKTQHLRSKRHLEYIKNKQEL